MIIDMNIVKLKLDEYEYESRSLMVSFHFESTLLKIL